MKNTGLIITLLSLFANVANAEIAVVDTKYIFENAKITKAANDEIMALTKKFKEDIKAQEASLAEKQDELAVKKAVLSKELYEEKLATLKKEIIEFRRSVKSKQKELEVNNTQKKQEIAEAISQVVESISKKNNYDAVLSKSFLMYNKADLEITEEVLNSLNSQK